MMKLPLGALALFAATVQSAASAGGVSREARPSPISRVVGLLTGLQTKLEADLKAETEIYENYRCWYKSIVDSKTASNSAAQSRIDSLKSYIKDIEAGKIEFTTERQDLEKQVSTLTQELDLAQQVRDQEAADFEAAKAEMEKAIDAMDEAINVLEAGMTTSFLRKFQSAKMLSVRWGLKKALEFGKDSLTSGDSKLIEDMLHGDVPKPDWKKLNRKATFKSKYEGQSGDVVKTLKKLKGDFSQNLEEAKKKEADAVAQYEKLKEAKGKMLETAQTALIDMSEENGARGLNKEEAQGEVDALEQQVKDDLKFIDEVEAAFTTKKAEWEEREKMRGIEIRGISEAIAVLHSDEARDAFSKSYQSASFVQVASSSRRQSSAEAAKALRTLAAQSKDGRISALAALAGSGAAGARDIAGVITAIDKLVETLEAEETTDLNTKETCEADTAKALQEARMTSLAIDDLTDDMGRAQDKIEELKAQIKEENEFIEETKHELTELERQRKDEHNEYLKSKADDEAAVQLIGQAEEVIKKMHEDLKAVALSSVVRKAAAAKPAGLAAVAAKVHHVASAKAAGKAAGKAAAKAVAKAVGKAAAAAAQPVEVAAGAAPPPPPATWDNPSYEGASGESQGVGALLGILKMDLEADIKAADKDEADAVTAFDEAKAGILAQLKDAKDSIAEYDGNKADQESLIVSKGEERTGKKDELDATMKGLKAMKPGCDFILVNFEVRSKARQIEIDGLKKAKAILQGADFA